MATNGNRWLKERGGKNPLSRHLNQKGKDSAMGGIQVEPGSSWIHKLTGLRFLVEDVDEELALLSPDDPAGTPLEVELAQFRDQFEPATR